MRRRRRRSKTKMSSPVNRAEISMSRARAMSARGPEIAAADLVLEGLVLVDPPVAAAGGNGHAGIIWGIAAGKQNVRNKTRGVRV